MLILIEGLYIKYLTMNFTFGTKNLTRVQKALQQLERLTPIQIQKIAGQESLAQLRLKRLQNHKQKFNNNRTICQQGQSGSGQEHERKQEGQGVRWNIFKQMPVLAYKESERKYQKQFMNKIDEYRKNIFKNQEDKWGLKQNLPHQQIPNPQPSDSKKNPIFSAVLANQTYSSGIKIQKQTPQANKSVFNKPDTNNIFTQNTSGTVNPPVFGNNVGTLPKTQQLKQPKPKNIGFVPNLTGSTSSDLFTKKFQVPEIIPPQKIDSKSSLFPESNPLSQVKITVPYNIFTSKPSDLFTKNNQSANVPKINIYQKKFNVQQLQPARPLQVGKGGLFSKSNPLSEIDSSKVSTNIFTNNTNNVNIFKNKEQTKPNPPKQSIQQQKSIFSHPPTSTPNIFTNSSSGFNKSADNQTNGGGLNLNLSGSLFQNKVGGNPISNPTQNIFENKKFGAVEQKNTNIFKNASFTPNAPTTKAPLFINPTNDKPNPFSFINNKKIEQPTILRQETEQKIVKYQPPAEQKGSFFNLKPVQVEPSLPKQEAQTPKQQVKAPPKKVNQIFKQFASKSSTTNMFSNQSANNASPFGKPPESGSIFGSLGKTGGGIFGDTSTNNSDNIFGKKDQVPMFGAKKQEEEQQEEDEGDDNDIIQYKEETDPTKSTGNYKYEQSEVIYRETIPKFKRTTNPIIENVIISIQKFSGNKNFTLSVRLSNKCINYSGTIVPGVTEASKIKQNQYKNLSVKKIMSMGSDNKPNLQLLKIQFRDEKQGRAFFDKISIAIKK